MNTPVMPFDAVLAMNSYVDEVIESLGEGDSWPLGEAWKKVTIWCEQPHIAAAIIYRHESLSDAPYRVIGGERGELADPRLCLVADELKLA